MLLKNITLSVVLFLSAIAGAQTTTIQLSDAQTNTTLSVYQPAPLVRPCGTPILISCSENSELLEKALIEDLAKTGCVAFLLKSKESPLTPKDVTKALEHILTNAIEYKIRTEKLGFLALGDTRPLYPAISRFAFVGLIDPVSLPDLKGSTVPVFIDASQGKSKEVLRVYAKASKIGHPIELHLHPQITEASVKSAEWVHWLGSLGYLKPLSEEKTEALKSKEAWEKLSKYYDDRLHKDWAWLKRYEEDNARMAQPATGEKRVIFMGDSITEGWINSDPEFFATNKYIDRGIGGQTTPQMLVRFREDVISLHPKVVILLAGINDIAENTGPSKIENVAGNIYTMSELAKIHGCKVIICSVLPAAAFSWHPGTKPTDSILRLNSLLKTYAEANNLAYVDYYSAAVDKNQGMKKELTTDGVHPNLAGYKIMEPLAREAVEKALGD